MLEPRIVERVQGVERHGRNLAGVTDPAASGPSGRR
jgi:hypothetical protein